MFTVSTLSLLLSPFVAAAEGDAGFSIQGKFVAVPITRTSRLFTSIRVVGFSDAAGGVPAGSVQQRVTLIGVVPFE